MKIKFNLLALLALSALNTLFSTAFAQGTVFTYQGHLKDAGLPASGNYDLTFALFDADSAGNQAGSTLTNTATTVSNGLFSVRLDFGPGVFTGTNLWLQLGVRTNGSGQGFTALSPRQPVTPTPYAIMAGSASNLLGSLPAQQLSGTLPASVLAGYWGSVAFTNSGNSFGGSFAGNGAGLSNVAATVANNVVFQVPVEDAETVYFNGFGTIYSAFRGSAVDMSMANGPWTRSGSAYVNHGFGTYFEPAYYGSYIITNAEHSDTVNHDILVIGPRYVADTQPGNWYCYGGSGNTIYSFFSTNYVSSPLITMVGGAPVLSGLSVVSSLSLAQANLSNNVSGRLQTNSVFITNGTLVLPGAYQGRNYGGAILWHDPTLPLGHYPDVSSELGFITTFKHWGSAVPADDQWMQLGAANIRLEPAWGGAQVSSFNHGLLVLGNEDQLTPVQINYSNGTNSEGLHVSTPLEFVAADRSGHYQLPGILGVFDRAVPGPVNHDGYGPGELWFYSLVPAYDVGNSVGGFTQVNVPTAKMHTNSWEFMSGLALDAIPYPPPTAFRTNQVYLWVSNTTLYSLHTVLNGVVWAATNKISGP